MNELIQKSLISIDNILGYNCSSENELPLYEWIQDKGFLCNEPYFQLVMFKLSEYYMNGNDNTKSVILKSVIDCKHLPSTAVVCNCIAQRFILTLELQPNSMNTTLLLLSHLLPLLHSHIVVQYGLLMSLQNTLIPISQISSIDLQYEKKKLDLILEICLKLSNMNLIFSKRFTRTVSWILQELNAQIYRDHPYYSNMNSSLRMIVN